MIRARIVIVVLIIGNVVLSSQLQSQAFSTVDRLQNINPTSKLATSQSTQPIAPKILGSSTSAHGASISIGGMSPDTGVYAVQWVPSGENFNSYQMFRTTSATMTVPYPTCARAYSFRVFVMSENWQLSDGHQTQNVTPHSEIFDLTMPPCVGSAAATTTTVALTCATGGTCALGDTGPGGGVVFYVASTPFTSTGSACATNCRYLEAAPANWQTHASIGLVAGADPTRAFATGGNVELAVVGADGTAIGTGYQNSVDIVNQTGNVAASSAAVLARAYTGGNKTDWHLASRFELDELYRERARVLGLTTTEGAVFSSAYRSSTELSSTQGSSLRFSTGLNISNGKGADTIGRVRPIRAF